MHADAHAARAHGIEGEDRAQQFAAARADEAGDADDLAATQLQLRGRGLDHPGQVPDLEHDLAWGADHSTPAPPRESARCR
jgi:hypothetical protein